MKKRLGLKPGLLLGAILLLCSVLVGHSSPRKLYISKDERAANRLADSLELIRLYQNTKGESWKVKWDLSQPIGAWHGIKLNKSEDRVYCIDLDGFPDCTADKKGGNRLAGNLPDLQLPGLTQLYLGGNEITGELPDFTGLPNVAVIGLSSNSLQGKIPTLSKLKNLQRLELDYNQLTGKIPVFKSPKLKQLYLPYNQLEGDLSRLNLPDLEVLLVQHNRLQGTMPDFKQMKNLKLINVSHNQLSGEIPAFLKQKKLKRIHLNNNEFTGLADMSGKSRSKREIYLADNQLGFSDLMPNIQLLNTPEKYKNQAPVFEDELIFKQEKDTCRMRLPADLVWTTNRYVWYKDGELLDTSDGNLGSLDFRDLKEEDSGIYHCEVKNKDLEDLHLISNIFALHVDDMSESISFIDSMVVKTDKSSLSNLLFPGRLFPNGKVSNRFKIISKTGDLDLSKSELQIFNAAGQLVYVSQSYDNDWRGTAMDTGNLLPPGVYFYAFRLNNDEQQIESGTFTLIL